MKKKYTFLNKRLIVLILQTYVVMMLSAQVKQQPAPIKISIKAITGLQYDLVRFAVKPGSKVTISLSNTDDMSHNLLVTRPGTRLKVVNAALQLAERGPQMDYIPKAAEVLWSIAVVSPGQEKSVTFTAPSKVGVYPYVCTYPGHGFVMYGAMYVTEKETLPEISTDINIPEGRRKEVAVNEKSLHTNHTAEPASPHPFQVTPPYLYRVFLEGASPAAIAVSLPSGLSYCWDAGTCKLRFAWKGAFVDNSDIWKGHFDASAKILGDIFFRDNVDYPLRVSGANLIPEVKFKGYRFVDKYPEFHYTLQGIDVYELVREKADGNGLVRQFRIPAATKPITFRTNPHDDAITYTCSSGTWKDEMLQLSPEEAKAFTITMTSYHLVFQRKKK